MLDSTDKMNRFPLIFLLWLCLEITSFVVVNNLLGLGMTLFLTLGAIMLGLSIIKRQGFDQLRAASEKMRNKEDGSLEASDGTVLCFAGLLLLIPGFVSDVVGLILLLPKVRHAICRRLSKADQSQTQSKDQSTVIEGEVVDEKKDEEKR